MLDRYALIRKIGGTLGLMIGFPFMASITSLVDFTVSMKSKNGGAKKIEKNKNQPGEGQKEGEH